MGNASEADLWTMHTTALAVEPQTNHALRREWAGFLLLAALVAMLGAGKAILASGMDPDCFWHLRVADELAQQSFPHPLVDDLSFASSKQPWTPYSWLAELGMKRLWDFGGYRAAIAVQALMQLGFLFMIALAGAEASAMSTGRPRFVASAVATAVSGLLSLAYLSFRPVTAALLLLAIIAWLLFRDRRLRQRSDAVWLVPFLTVLTANVHFYALLVPLWTGAFFVGDFIEKRDPRRGLALLTTTIAGALATPMLPGTLTSVWNYAFNDRVVRSGMIAEMRPFYAGGMGHVSAALVALIVVCAIWRAARREMRWGEFLLLAGSTVLLFKVGRMAPVFAIVACPILDATMPQLSDRTLAKTPVMIGTGLVLLIGLAKLVIALPGDKPLSQWLDQNGPKSSGDPCAAADYVQQHITPVTGHIICEFTWGGYLEWRLNPRFQMLMDGRTQVFPPEFWRSLFFGTPEDRVRVVLQSRADAAVLPIHGSMFRHILEELKWKVVFHDDFGEVWIPPKP